MPKISKPIAAVPNPQNRTPPRQPPVQPGRDLGWDLREVPSSYLVAELVRRGECPPLQTAKPQQAAPTKDKTAALKDPVVKSPSLFG